MIMKERFTPTYNIKLIDMNFWLQAKFYPSLDNLFRFLVKYPVSQNIYEICHPWLFCEAFLIDDNVTHIRSIGKACAPRKVAFYSTG
jgi:hypothetical protein